MTILKIRRTKIKYIIGGKEMLECQNKRLIEEASNAWEALTLANNFLFQKVMQNEEL